MSRIISVRSVLVMLLWTFGIGTSLARADATQIQEQPVRKPAAPVPVATKSWTDHVKIKGDVRLRLETVNDDSKKNAAGEHYTRDRLRTRARLAAEAKLENLKTGIRISTGGADPISGNVTLGEGDQKKEIRLDLAYLDYNFLGGSPYELHAIGGKMKNPLITYKEDLVWDSDLTPEGIAAKAKFGNDWLTFLGNAEGLYIKDRKSEPNAIGWIGQGALRFAFIPEVNLTVGGSYSAYQNMKGYDVIDWANNNNSYGNSTINGSVNGGITNKAWACDFTPIMGFGKLDLFVWKIPVTIFGQALTNPGADDNKNGFMGGISFLKAKNPRTFEFGYSYAKLEKDAVLGMWTDSDRWGGGTDGKGSRFYGKYQITKHLQFSTTFFLDTKHMTDPEKKADYNRLQVNLQASF